MTVSITSTLINLYIRNEQSMLQLGVYSTRNQQLVDNLKSFVEVDVHVQEVDKNVVVLSFISFITL